MYHSICTSEIKHLVYSTIKDSVFQLVLFSECSVDNNERPQSLSRCYIMIYIALFKYIHGTYDIIPHFTIFSITEWVTFYIVTQQTYFLYQHRILAIAV